MKIRDEEFNMKEDEPDQKHLTDLLFINHPNLSPKILSGILLTKGENPGQFKILDNCLHTFRQLEKENRNILVCAEKSEAYLRIQ